jgi:uncharacterized protein (TIGR01319 family)
MDVMALNDGRRAHEKIGRVRQLRPDMILLSGGTDGGEVRRVVELAEVLAAAEPKARLGGGCPLPVIYAGNRDAAELVRERLGGRTAVRVAANLRPTLEREELGPARDAIHELFMEHVMAHAPGYGRLLSWTSVPVMPTPGAVGLLIENMARREGTSVVAADIGGATTDVFSVFQGVFHRTVSANLGLSYSIGNVLAEAGLEGVARWLPFPVDEGALRNQVRNKMIRPTTIPQTLEDLLVEQAIAREALRLAFAQHKSLAVGLKGAQAPRTISDALRPGAAGGSLVDLMGLRLLVGSGGVLSHAPRRVQAALMLVDAFLPEGVTELAVDSVFMAPHLGVLSTVHEEAARQVFERDCLIRLGTVIAPVGVGREGQPCVSVRVETVGAPPAERGAALGELARVVGPHGRARIVATPARGFDLGAGNGKPVERRVAGGVVGVLVDARGRRPFALPSDLRERAARLRAWHRTLQVYPREV